MKNSLIYCDDGVAPDCVEQVRLSLQQISGQSPYLIDAETLLKGEWPIKTSLFIMPGGRDVLYHKALIPKGTQVLKKFVENGGTYLGICAGAYFGCAKIEFEKGGDLEVVGERDLGFFPGTAIGPAYGLGEFRYETSAGARISKMIFSDGFKASAYFKGGCLFENAHLYQHVKVLARYEDIPGQPAAIIECRIGKGRAILTGVHLEYSPHYIVPNCLTLRRIRTNLLKTEALRVEGLKKILMTNHENLFNIRHKDFLL